MEIFRLSLRVWYSINIMWGICSRNQNKMCAVIFSPPSSMHIGVRHFISAGMSLWKWHAGLQNLLFSLMFTTAWHSQSVTGGLYLHISPDTLVLAAHAQMRKGYWEWKRNRKRVWDMGMGMGMILVSLLACLLGQWGSWWYYRIACSGQGSCEPRWVLGCT